MVVVDARNMGRRPLRVAHLAGGLEMGGLERLLVELARHSPRAEVCLHFFSLSTTGVLGGEIAACGWPVTPLKKNRGLWPSLIPRLASLFRRGRFDLIHTHDPRSLIYGGPAARLARVPGLVHTWHGRNLQAAPRELYLVRWLSRLTQRLVAVSHEAANYLRQQGIVPDRLCVVVNGIALERFPYRGPCQDGPLVTVARLSPEKDLDTLLKALALLRPDYPALHLDIAGDGPCREHLQRLAAALGLANAVRFHGLVRDVASFLARGRLFVLPSLTEGMSLTLLEAMATGLPVVATSVGGNPEVVLDGQTGLLVPARQPEALAQALRRLLREPERLLQLGAAGRRHVEQCFDVRQTAAAYARLYREVLATPPQAAEGLRLLNATPGQDISGHENKSISNYSPL
jgi:glycosyltransferase involved in cell wall biosynthesis